MESIDDLVLACVGAEFQPIKWRRSSWESLWVASPGLPGREVLDLIDAEVNGLGNGTIRRSWVRSLADLDPVVFLAASTIWGYGDYVRRGRPALRAMLLSGGVAATMESIIRASRSSAADGFISLFDRRRKTRIAHLGIAFGTKAVHFAGYEFATPRPLVLDARVYRSALRVAPTAPVPDPAKRTTGEKYAEYCSWAGGVAERLAVAPELVEFALFSHGQIATRSL